MPPALEAFVELEILLDFTLAAVRQI